MPIWGLEIPPQPIQTSEEVENQHAQNEYRVEIAIVFLGGSTLSKVNIGHLRRHCSSGEAKVTQYRQVQREGGEISAIVEYYGLLPMLSVQRIQCRRYRHYYIHNSIPHGQGTTVGFIIETITPRATVSGQLITLSAQEVWRPLYKTTTNQRAAKASLSELDYRLPDTGTNTWMIRGAAWEQNWNV